MAILDFGALIRQLGPAAVKASFGDLAEDKLAISVVMNSGSEDRVGALRGWFRYYGVLQGFTLDQRNALCQAVLNWMDSQRPDSALGTTDSLLSVHISLANACVAAFGKSRNFASLTSKALWLRYPNEVPLYDRYAQQALWMLAKIEPNLPRIEKVAAGYAPFAILWRAFYDRYASEIAAIPAGDYPYRVRIFDRILWILGAPTYSVASALGIQDGENEEALAERSAGAKQGEDLQLRSEAVIRT